VGKWEEAGEKEHEEEEAMIGKTAAGDIILRSICPFVQSRDQVDFETQLKRLDDLLSAGRFCDWKARGSKSLKPQTASSVLQLLYATVL